ncbi:ammonium transporter [Amanita rubescens]|nr:ammonium transporter [Amanita rubescens]
MVNPAILITPSGGKLVVYNMGDIAFVLISTVLVFIMIPGVGFFYSGLLRRKNALSMIHMSMVSVAVVTFQWFWWGYSLAFSDTASAFIGDLRYFALKNVLAQQSVASPKIPAILFCIYQLMFAAITPCIACGAIAERGRMGPLIVFIFVWSTLVYDPIACWTWNPHGWSAKLGGLDFAGGTPVHISSGTAALAISIYLGKRRGYGTDRLAYRPQNVSYVILGTVFLWFGWFGFNGGSALSANLRAVQASIVTNLATAVAALTWMLWDYRHESKWSAVGFCSGAISGLVAITPASGYVGAPAAVVYGVMAGTGMQLCNQTQIFASHAIGGVIGNLLTGFFAQVKRSPNLMVSPRFLEVGWTSHWVQLGIQLADSTSGMAWSFTVTTIILWVMHFIPGLSMRGSEEAEILGIDDAEMGEYAYDYVGLETEIGHVIPPAGEITTEVEQKTISSAQESRKSVDEKSRAQD